MQHHSCSIDTKIDLWRPSEPTEKEWAKEKDSEVQKEVDENVREKSKKNAATKRKS